MIQGIMFEATEVQRRQVRSMAAVGLPQDDIATLLEIDAKTLRKYFRRELDSGSIEATAKVAQSLFQMATQGKNVAAAIFWMKARAGWREKHEVAVTSPSLSHISDADLNSLIVEELIKVVPNLVERKPETAS
ncbi:hypothetical protein E2C06_20090 [Dankookia rubra]|uniref:Uncharacterized protein n=1 Tax=Dankookia rubra TaxID=1442381 RepID=A0A4R5QCD8_9PROT|nr:hypothetical protein [Dankookia rubra]TDH60800.1 hypothetical protein E2C06_20090 [Dankookia rubra]